MAPSHMRYVVSACAVLIALQLIIGEESHRKVAEHEVWNDIIWTNFTDAMNTTKLRETIIATSQSNSSTLNAKPVNLVAEASAEKSFYLREFPRLIFLYVLLVPLQYYWNIYLERFLPSRIRRGRVLTTDQSPQLLKAKSHHGVVGEDGGEVEEEVVRRLIAQGKVKRSSLNICNTILKWTLDVTIGKILYEAVWHVVEGVIQRRSFSSIKRSLFGNIVACLFSSLVSTKPLASLIGFLVIPAYQRVVFLAGIELAEVVFLAAFCQLVLPGIVTSNWAQSTLQHFTENAYIQAELEILRTARAKDEL